MSGYPIFIVAVESFFFFFYKGFIITIQEMQVKFAVSQSQSGKSEGE